VVSDEDIGVVPRSAVVLFAELIDTDDEAVKPVE
jgi:hypothetical protein